MATRCESGVDFEKIDFESLSNMKNYISKGSFGAVYGPFTWNSKKFAVKHILIGHEIPDQFEAKVEAKKNIWTSLKHEHLIEIHYVSLKPKAVYVVMEYASGGSLRQLLDNSDAKNHLEIYVSNWARQIAEGMLYLHDRDRPIVHRDLKSSNIVVMEPFDSLNAHVKRTLKITDFDNVQEHVGTATMSLSGTCTHMAPEVLLHQRFSKASDVWSYGVVIWEMLTRELPHKGQAVGPLVMKASSGELTLSIPDSVPKEIKELLGECWCQDTKSRLRFKNIIDRLNSISDSENAVSDISTVNKTMNDEIHCNANTSQSCSYKWRWLQDNDFTVESSTAVLKARKPGWHRCEAECYLRNETCKLLVLRALIHGETESSQEGAMISYVVIPAIVTLVVVGALIFVFFWIRRRRVRNSCVSREEHAPLIKEHPESHAVIRNHQFLEEHIESSPVIHLLHEKNCITDVKRDQFLNHPSNDYRNEALLQWMRTLSFNEYKGQKVLECFRQTKQNFVADVLEKGGVLVKSKISTTLMHGLLSSCSNDISSINVDVLKEKEAVVIKRLNQPQGLPLSSSQKAASEIPDDDILIAPYCQQEGNRIVIWFWCLSKNGHTNLQYMYVSGKLLERLIAIFKEFPNNKVSSAPEVLVPTTITIFVDDFTKNDNEKEAEIDDDFINKRLQYRSEHSEAINGLSVLGQELFISRVRTTDIEVYDSTTFHFKRRIAVSGMTDPEHIVSCAIKNCLYAVDREYQNEFPAILKLDPTNGYLIKTWNIYGIGGRLSIANDTNVILNINYKAKLHEYTADGELIRKIILAADTGIIHARHAVKLDNGQFIVCHCGNYDPLSRVCLMSVKSTTDAMGRIDEAEILKTFCPEEGEPIHRLWRPIYLSVDNGGSVLVLDGSKNRAVLLSSNLDKPQIIVSEDDGMKIFRRTCFDDSTRQWFLVDHHCVMVCRVKDEGVVRQRHSLISQ